MLQALTLATIDVTKKISPVGQHFTTETPQKGYTFLILTPSFFAVTVISAAEENSELLFDTGLEGPELEG